MFPVKNKLKVISMKRLILTPNKNEMCGMYQLAKDLTKELNADIGTKSFDFKLTNYDEIITFLYPMHLEGRYFKDEGLGKWICYDQKVPPPTKKYFPKFHRRMCMKWFYWANERSKKGADKYWELSEREQKPFFEGKKYPIFTVDNGIDLLKPYALYVGRTTDYKNFDWLQKTMKELNIDLKHPKNISKILLYSYYINAKIFVSASLWEGYGRPVMEAEALGIPAVAYNVGTHKKHIKKGICVPVEDEEAFKEAVKKIWEK